MNEHNECGCGRHHGHGEETEHNCGHGEHESHHSRREEGGMHHEGGCGCSCHQEGGRHHGGGQDFNCGCHQNKGIYAGHGFGRFGQRRFISKEEIVARLEEYLKQLQAEVKGVEERLVELKKEG
jgi:hypothetical protein